MENEELTQTAQEEDTQAEYKSLNATIYGVLEEIKQHSACKTIKLIGNGGMVNWCFLSSDEDYSDLVGKRVSCSACLSKRPVGTETEIYGFETSINVFKIRELKPLRQLRRRT